MTRAKMVAQINRDQWPMKEHPAYAGEPARQIRELMQNTGNQRIEYVTPVKPLTDWTAPPMSIFRTVRRTFEIRRCYGPMPYTGRVPFAYVWLVAVDDLGRSVAGPAERTVLPEDFRWGHRQPS